jgi:CheY-like chemotaxis protein
VQSTPLDGAVHVTARSQEGRAHICVRDTGEGIAAGELPQIFERFGQADASKSRHHGGLGLGLGIVRSLVELHGGCISVRSDGPGLGTTVEVVLPLAQGSLAEAAGAGAAEAAQAPDSRGAKRAQGAPGGPRPEQSAVGPDTAARSDAPATGPASGASAAAQAPNAPAAAQAPNAPAAAQAPNAPAAAQAPDAPAAAQAPDAPGAEHAPLAWRRILVLEDEADSLELMTVLLREQGAIVQAFDNAEEALAAAENVTFDLIISDLGMAGMDGLEFMRRLKRRPLPVKAMALTAYSGDAQHALALDAGYCRVEVKPISPPQLLEVVCAELARPPTGTGLGRLR